jgi:hypothetical protein
MLEICEQEDAMFWDLFEIMGGLNSVRTWEEHGLAKRDKIHFTKAGYILEADLFSNAFVRDFGDFLAAKNPYVYYEK